jgi:hypothetical protein
MPTPKAGSVQRLQPDRDIAKIWPSMHVADNCLFDVSFVARSPHKGAAANVRVASVTFERTKNTPAAVKQAQLDIIAAYRSRFPSIDVRPSSEFSRQLPDLTGFGIPQYFPHYDTMSADVPTAYRQIVADVQSQGGLVSWNHPFGYDSLPVISADAQVAKRRQVYQTMTELGVYDVDILEVGYVRRGECDAATHLDLWDTFSRAGRFLTGNGVTDDHSGQAWANLYNGFGTAVWADSRSDADVGAALSGGRAFLHHMGRWPGAALDLRVDGKAEMGAAWVGGTMTAGGAGSQRLLSVLADALPAGSVVQVVGGPVDRSGSVDPGTQVVSELPAAGFAGGPVDVSVDARKSCFYRVQVLASDGTFIGSSNPVWLLDSDPDDGVPPARQVG